MKLFTYRVLPAQTAIIAVAIVATTANIALAQLQVDRNNPYSPSPGGGDGMTETIAASRPEPVKAAFKLQTDVLPRDQDKDDKLAGFGPAPTLIYRVGIGDVLSVRIRNTAAEGYYTVRRDGTIDFPLVTQDPIVAGQPVAVIETILRSRVTLYPDPDIEVRVRGYGSHKVTVSGAVDIIGEHSLQREAVPLYVIRAMTFVHPDASSVMITRSLRFEAETYDLRDPLTDNVTIFPGDRIEFVR